jgi:uncharacterized protein (TIGR00159 family)
MAAQQSWLERLAAAVRPADLVDIVVVACVAYLLIGWALRIGSRHVVVGMFVVAAIYLLARVLELHLTLYLFRAAVTVALVALLIIFQEDLRRGFERLAAGQWQRKRIVSDAERQATILMLAAAALAKRRRGALIVITGRETIERHLVGGVPCQGTVTEPLLESLFDPSSAGHDGAVILEGNRITKFGVHLPLSPRVSGGRELGTRHAAALGLSERTDALVLVVSEERGIVSIAQDGELEAVTTYPALHKRLETFLTRRSRHARVPDWRGTLRPSVLVRAVLAFAIALGGWLVVLGTEYVPITRILAVPVAFRHVPEHWMIEDDDHRYVEVTLSGPSGAFKRLDAGSLIAVVDARELKEGAQRAALGAEHIEVPDGVTVERVDPSSLRFVAHRLETIEAAVEPTVKGAPPELELEADPPTVRLMVPASSRRKHAVVRTEPIDARELESKAQTQVALGLARGTRLAEGTEETVTVRIAPKNKEPQK